MRLGRREMKSEQIHLRGVGGDSSRVQVPRVCASTFVAAASLAVGYLAVTFVAVTFVAVLPLSREAAAQAAVTESVQSRPRLDFESYGIALDGANSAGVSGASLVQAFTRAELDTGYDSNVQRTDGNVTGSAFAVLRPGISLRAEGELVTAFATLQVESTRFASSDEDASDDVSLTIGGLSQPDDDLELAGSLGLARDHLSRENPNDLGPGFDLTTYKEYNASASVRTLAIADTPATVRAAIDLRSHDDTNGIDRSALDRVTGTLRARIGLGGSSDLYYFVQPGLVRTQYTSDTTFGIDSTRYDLAGGFTWDSSALSTFTGFAGISQRHFDEGSESALTSGLVGANGTWNVTPLMTLTGRFSIANEDTNVATASSALVTSAGIGLDYDPLDNLILSANMFATQTDYEGSGGSESRMGFNVGAKYLLSENFYLSTSLGHRSETSDNGTSDFGATVAMFRIGAKLCCLTDQIVEGQGPRRFVPSVVNGVFR